MSYGIKRGYVITSTGRSSQAEASDAEERKATPVYSGVIKYFPDAIREISKVSFNGTKQHHPDKDMFWDKTKSTDHSDSMMRHLMDHEDNPIDDDGGLHLAKCAWRALANLQIYLDGKKQ